MSFILVDGFQILPFSLTLRALLLLVWSGTVSQLGDDVFIAQLTDFVFFT